jgi:hypothetical protein
MRLYPDSGPVVSAGNGRFTTSRDSIEAGIRSFWTRMGQNMRSPRWVWGPTVVEILSPDAAVLTGAYSIPHTAPNGQPHVVGGVWTALFERRQGRWVITQEHLSDPGLPMGSMDPESSKAAPAKPGTRPPPS